jgi:hypothetical protein
MLLRWRVFNEIQQKQHFQIFVFHICRIAILDESKTENYARPPPLRPLPQLVRQRSKILIVTGRNKGKERSENYRERKREKLNDAEYFTSNGGELIIAYKCHL